MKSFKYSPLRAKYNRYVKIKRFFSCPMIAWLFIVFPAAIGGGMFEKHIFNFFSIGCVVLALLLVIYIFISICFFCDERMTYEEYAKNQSYKATEKAIRKNKKWII